MRSPARILIFSLLLVIVTLMAVVPTTVSAQNSPRDEECVRAAAEAGANEQDLTPPRLYFLPFCDQTPVYSFEGKNFDKYCHEVKSCQADDFVQLFVNMSNAGLIALPVIALLFFIWAGFNLIQSGGNPEKVNQAKKMMLGVILGVVIIVILAWFWTTFVVFILTGDTEVFGNPWWGGTPAGDESGITGCCATSLGCVDSLFQDECNDKPGATWIQATSCNTLTQCQLLEAGCCVPKFIDDYGTCGIPDPLRGCSDTVRYELKQVSCESEPKCEVWGCCVYDAAGTVCDPRSTSTCDSVGGTLYPNTACASVPDC